MTSDKPSRDISDIREQVHNLLKEGSSQKLLRYETKKALKKLQKADELIDKYDLPEPWPSLCAYRLGHLALRTASNEKELKEARAKFLVAKGSKCLGPLPDIYNLAVLYRLKMHDPENTKRAFAIAEQSIEHLQMKEDPRLQDHTFNLLELATYFSGLDYQDLEGIGFPQKRLSSPSAWMVVGPDPQWSTVMYSEAQALEELAEWMKRDECQNAVFFKLSDKDAETATPLRRHWKYKGKDWQKTSYQRLRLLALLLARPGCPLDALGLALVGEDATPNALSQNKRRLKSDLSILTGRNENEIYDPSFPELPRINPQIQIFGAVEWSAIHLEDYE